MNAHTLTITDTDDGLRYRIDCDGLTDACRTWQECDAKPCDPAALSRADEEGDDEVVLHGVTHRHLVFGGTYGWAVENGTCWLKEDPDWPEPARDLGLGPGVYRVVHIYDDRDQEFYTLKVVETL